MKESTSLGIIMGYLPADIRRAVENAGSLASLTELRLNIGRPASLIFPDKILYLTSHGTTASANNLSCVKCTRSDLDSIMDSIMHYSFHSHITELKTGSIMLENRNIRSLQSGRTDNLSHGTELPNIALYRGLLSRASAACE